LLDVPIKAISNLILIVQHKKSCRWRLTCLIIKVLVVDDDALANAPALVAHLILECWWNNPEMAFSRLQLPILLLTERQRWTVNQSITGPSFYIFIYKTYLIAFL